MITTVFLITLVVVVSLAVIWFVGAILAFTLWMFWDVFIGGPAVPVKPRRPLGPVEPR